MKEKNWQTPLISLYLVLKITNPQMMLMIGTKSFAGYCLLESLLECTKDNCNSER